MAFWDFRRGVGGLQVLLEFGKDRGIGADVLFKGTGLALTNTLDPRAEVLAAQELQVINNLLNHLEDPPSLGWEVGQRYHLSSYGLWGYGLISSEDVRSAIGLALKFVRLTYAFTLISFREGQGGGVLQFGEPDLPPDLVRFLVQRDMSASMVLLAELIGENHIQGAVQFRSKLGPDIDLPADWPGERPPRGVNALGVSKALLDRKLQQANPVTVAMCESLCAELLEKRLSTTCTADRVRAHLRIPGMLVPDLPAMADLLHLSPRTLRRRLAAEGTSFRQLCAVALEHWAEELLADPRLSVSAVADRLGFADISSFSQAFTRWKGCSPSQFRASLNELARRQ